MITNNHKYLIPAVIAFISFFCFSCEKDDLEGIDETNITTGNPLKLEVSKDTIILDQDYDDRQAILFTWEPGRDRGLNSSLTYLFKVDVANGDFTTALETEEMPEGIFFKSFTTKELNDLIENHWKEPLGENIEFSVRVIAKANSEDKFLKPDYSTINFVVKGYKHQPYPLFLVGDATPSGWDLNRGIELEELESKNKYRWRGNLNAGSFKILQEIGNALPSFNKGEGDGTMVLRDSEEQPDNLFVVPEDGIYSVVVYRRNLKIVCEKTGFQRVYIRGSATPAGWGSYLPLDWNITRPDVFEVTMELKSGELKFETEENSWCPTFRPLIPNGSIVTDLDAQVAISPDFKWRVKDEEAGTYKISLDTKSLRVNFEKIN
ncbi:protein of unknown function [Mariniphaga anaerophila]|uniref:SusE outer membrane protein domain-containing protein n=1 Tax=Mariniphaga anaerophila TaxID=1484053 RepID=A0A1M4W9W3_9BACT|nr:SusF/SusE family outer membrane protein [Mariniphaga anaerophila]SHE77950.1 protein of unknown function [Mariniphaga anaerophila]